MASHGVARTVHIQTEQERLKDLKKIEKYQTLEREVQIRNFTKDYSVDTFNLTTKLVSLNPEYYTIWNVRRRCTISVLLSSSSAGYFSSMELPSSSPTATTSTFTGASSVPLSAATQCSQKPQLTGQPGITAERTEAWNNITDPAVAGPGVVVDVKFLKEELVFLVPMLMLHPKCYWLWDHRVWLLQQAIERLPPRIARAIWEEELALDSKMLMRDRRNFHAWGYRKNLVEKLESPVLLGTSLTEKEFEYTSTMIRSDLSNFSAWHRRAMLIPKLLRERNATDADRKSFLEEELEFVQSGLNVGPEDQSLWYYHQFLMLNVVSLSPENSFVPLLLAKDRIAILDKQIESIEELLEDYQKVKWIYEALLEYKPYKAVIEKRETNDEEKEILRDILTKLEILDDMRTGRWRDTRAALSL